MGQPLVVDNRTGGAGAIGASEVARAKPDGYTLLLTITDSQINNAALFRNLSYDPRRDFIPIAQIVRSPALISTHAAMGMKTLADLRARAISSLGKLSYASWGIGGLGHVAGESLNRALEANMVHIPQRSEAPFVTGLLSGTVDIGLSSVGSMMQHLQAGKIVPLAVLGAQRSSTMPVLRRRQRF